MSKFRSFSAVDGPVWAVGALRDLTRESLVLEDLYVEIPTLSANAREQRMNYRIEFGFKAFERHTTFTAKTVFTLMLRSFRI